MKSSKCKIVFVSIDEIRELSQQTPNIYLTSKEPFTFSEERDCLSSSFRNENSKPKKVDLRPMCFSKKQIIAPNRDDFKNGNSSIRPRNSQFITLSKRFEITNKSNHNV